MLEIFDSKLLIMHFEDKTHCVTRSTDSITTQFIYTSLNIFSIIDIYDMHRKDENLVMYTTEITNLCKILSIVNKFLVL